MLKKEFTFKNLDGEEVTETYYFNISTAEIAKMALIEGDDLAEKLQKIVDSKDGAKIIETFEGIIRMSVGARSEDGRNFVKTPSITEAFMGSEAYGQLFLELVTKADVAAEFINGVMPGDLKEKAKALQAAGFSPKKVIDGELPKEERRALTFEDFSAVEMDALNLEDMQTLYAGELYERPKYLRGFNPDDYTNNELMQMSPEVFDQVVGIDPKKWSKRVLVIAMQRKTQTGN